MRLLNEQIPHGVRVFEAGCGTGQETNYLAMDGTRDVIGADLCLNSLKLARTFKQENGISHADFLRMNLFRPPFAAESFDYVISNGVLHHTRQPREAFRSITRLVKPGGFIIMGLYNAFGRLTHDLRRLFFNLSYNHFKFLDPRLSDPRIAPGKRRVWFMDQYRHPCESKHTFGETLNWFHREGVRFISSIPKMRLAEDFTVQEQLFEPTRPGNFFERTIAQWDMLWTPDNEGGFFIMIGQKK